MFKQTAPLNIYQSLPKVELHRHLEGSLRLSTLLEIARAHGVTVPASILRLSNMVQVQDQDPLSFSNFLDKFKTLRLFYRSPEIIDRITREAIEDAARDNIRYLELRFTPIALSRAEGFPLHDVINWVATSAHQASKRHQIPVGLIISINRHEPIELAEQVAWLAAEYASRGIVALDLAGNEAEFSAEPFVSLFKEARQAGLHLTLHAGEWGEAQNVRQAIELFQAERIGHGVKVMADENIVALARERGTVFEVCVTSNYQSGAVSSLRQHPLPRMLDAGLKATINTDDPSVSRITLTHEYQLACEKLGLSFETLKGCILTAAQAAFLPEAERGKITAQLAKELTHF
ncbi:MAG: adenosine deaminase [Anaerolineae bacterium]